MMLVVQDLRGLKAPPPVDTTTAVDMTTIDEKYFNTMLPRVPYETETVRYLFLEIPTSRHNAF
jgi:hypothetical protein